MWKHFIKETDDKRWTAGKRRAEADTLVGVQFLTTIQVLGSLLAVLKIFLESTNSLQAPSILPETESNIDRSLGQFTKELGQMDTAVKKISDIAVDQANKYKNTMKKDYQVFKSVDVGLCFALYLMCQMSFDFMKF